MTRYELGIKAGEIAIKLHRENSARKTGLGKKYNVFARYLTGNVLGGTYPMPKVYANMEKNAKTEKTIEAIHKFIMDIAEAGLTKTSFYACAGYDLESKQEYPWIGQDFENGFWAAIGNQASI